MKGFRAMRRAAAFEHAGHGGRLRAFLAAAAVMVVTGSGAVSCAGLAAAQPVEQHPAPILSGERISNLPEEAIVVEEHDPTPLGVDLAGIVVASERGVIRVSARVAGIVVDSDRAILQDPALAAALEPFLGQPLSRRLIAELRDAIVRYMRSQSRPLVSVIVPPQEVTAGTVQLLVIPFTLGDKRVERTATGHVLSSDEQIVDEVRLERGDEIVADRLVSDVNWLMRNPFRRVGIVFEPGTDVDTTDLVLRLTETRPWQAFGGIANSGTEATDRMRLFGGFVAANPLVFDHRLSYQLTAAPNTFASGELWGDMSADSGYVSHAMSYFLPLSWRHIVMPSAAFIHSRSVPTFPFVEDTTTFQTRVEYVVPMEGLWGQPDLFAGFNFKRQQTELYFANILVSQTYQDIAQFIVGARGELIKPEHTTLYDLSFFLSPGGLTQYNTDAVFSAVSGDPDASARYAYANGGVEHYRRLSGGFGLKLELAFQLASAVLPDIERFGVGGVASVRGYDTNEISGDNGYMVRSEIRLPSLSGSPSGKGLVGDLNPFGFFDIGDAGSWDGTNSDALASVGLGLDCAITDHAELSFAWAVALRDGPETDTGDQFLHVNFTASF